MAFTGRWMPNCGSTSTSIWTRSHPFELDHFGRSLAAHVANYGLHPGVSAPFTRTGRGHFAHQTTWYLQANVTLLLERIGSELPLGCLSFAMPEACRQGMSAVRPFRDVGRGLSLAQRTGANSGKMKP
jgi:hypothetical protein